jgi:hypothetical protein
MRLSFAPFRKASALPSWLAAASGPEDSSERPNAFDSSPAGREDLPYQVELWDKEKKAVEQVLAMTANGSIGYAAYYAAAREYPDRYVTLRHKKSIIARSNAPGR